VGALVAGVGYIGAKLIEDLVSAGEEVVALDNLSATSPAVVRALQNRLAFRFVKGSVLNPSKLREALRTLGRVDCVYHLAAQASSHADAATPRYTENTNLLGSRLVFEEAFNAGASRIVFASSLRVYGPFLVGRVTEDHPYGRFQDLSHLSKCYVEKLLEMMAYERGLTAVSVRLGVVHGLSPVMKTDYRYMTAPNKFCRQAVRGERIRVHPSAQGQIGLIHVADASVALRTAAGCQMIEPYFAANAAPEVCSVARLAKLVREQAEARGLRVEIEGPTESEPAQWALVGSRLNTAGFAPQRQLGDSLGEVLDYFAARERIGRRG